MAATSSMEDTWSASTTCVGPPPECQMMKRTMPTGSGASEQGGPPFHSPVAAAVWEAAVEGEVAVVPARPGVSAVHRLH
eukprot:4516329-Alexandrium_andersonii.AAC.1